jgi:putative ABC transport system permease protein
MRGALGSFRILIAGVALGVFTIAAIDSIANGVLAAVRANAKEIIGGDVSLRLFHAPASPEQREFLSKAAYQYSETAELRPLARRGDGSLATLVELKGADQAYPLYGKVELTPAMPLAAALELRDGRWGAAADPALLDSLNLGQGDVLRLGELEFEIRALILAEPDRLLRAFSLGPRVMIARAALERTGLAEPGAAIYWYNRLRLPEGTDARAWITSAKARFPDAGWRVVNAEDGAPGIERSVHIARVMLILTGFSVLLIGGVGVGGAVTAHLGRKAATIAILSSVGASRHLIFLIYLIQVLMAAGLGIGLGLAAGSLAPLAARGFLAEWLPSAVIVAKFEVLAVAAAFGLIAALLFALWPLGVARSLPPQDLFRQLASRKGHGRPSRAILLAMAILAAILLLLLILLSEMPILAMSFLLSAGLAVGIFYLMAQAIAALAGRLGRIPGRPLLRLALSNLHRPGAITLPVVMSFGLGLTLLVAIKSIESLAVSHLAHNLPQTSPDLVVINLPPSGGADFMAKLSDIPGIVRIERAPFLHASVTRLNGRAIHDIRVPPDINWVLRGDRGLSWPLEQSGERWWDEGVDDMSQASIDAAFAHRLGLKLGDSLTLNILGHPHEARIVNLRKIDWSRLGLDFPILLSPPALPPLHSQIAALWLKPESINDARTVVTQHFPESPVIGVAPVLAFLGGILNKAGDALAAISFLTVVAALVVLAGNLASGYRRRLHEMVVLKVVGATPIQLALASVIEFALLGGVTALAAGGLGMLFAFAIASAVLPGQAAFSPLIPLGLGLAAMGLMAMVGFVMSRLALRRSPGKLLRDRLAGF